MLFNSYTFLFLFLPVVLIVFFWLGNTLGSSVALGWFVLSSLAFYANWDVTYPYLWLLIGSMIFNYGAAWWIMRASALRGCVAGLAVMGNVLLLLYYKAVLVGLTGMDGTPLATFSTGRDVLIPLAISFITFQQIAFLVDAYRRKLRRLGTLDYCFFTTFFPHLVMGPIVHYREIVPQLGGASLLRWSSDNFAIGLSILIVGLFKKVVIADNIAPYVNQVYDLVSHGQEVSSVDAWGAAIGFPLQLYFDFSGYADMAIGLARMFNIKLPINFDSPYRAVGFFDLWNRWHISFSSFMREYVFFPLARSQYMRVGKTGALLLTTVLSGLWHGLGATFLVWSALQGLVMAADHHLAKILFKFGIKRRQHSRGFPWLAMFMTFFVFMLLGVFFRAKELWVAFTLFEEMYNGVQVALIGNFSSLPGDGNRLLDKLTLLHLVLMAVVVWGFPNTQRFFGTHWNAIDQRMSAPQHTAPDLLPGARHIRFAPNRFWAAVMALMFLIALLQMSESSRFVYYQF
jgi:alginate O-acetyltransferase complex protein AlgI